METPEKKTLTLLQAIRRLWLWGCLDDPSLREGVFVSDEEWRKLVRDCGHESALFDDPAWARQQWVRVVFKVELEWRLWRAMLIGAVLGFLLALR